MKNMFFACNSSFSNFVRHSFGIVPNGFNKNEHVGQRWVEFKIPKA